MRIIKKIIIGGLLFGISDFIFAGNLLGDPHENSRIYFKGCNYIDRSPDRIIPCRFSDAVLKMDRSVLHLNPDTARRTSGIKMFFATSSRNIRLNFTLMPEDKKTPVIIRVYRDGTILKDCPFVRLPAENPVGIRLDSSDGKPHSYQVDFPSNVGTVLTGLELDEGSVLNEMKFHDRPVYVALGDSITHGTVALDGLSAGSYAYLLAEKLDYDLYNLAVGGSKVSVPVGEMLADWREIDLITLLIGYNDLVSAGVSLEAYRDNYLRLIAAIRKTHPSTPLFCITLTYTQLEKSPKTEITPDEYRKVVVEIVKSLKDQGDHDLFLVHGDQLTDESCLHDRVHFNAHGNGVFAERLYEEILKDLKL